MTSWPRSTRSPVFGVELATTAPVFGHKASVPSRSGSPTSDHQSSPARRIVNPRRWPTAGMRLMTKRSSTPSASTRGEAHRDLDRGSRQRLRRQAETGRDHPGRPVRRDGLGHRVRVHDGSRRSEQRRGSRCRCVRGAYTLASSRVDAGRPPAPPGSGECGVLAWLPAWRPRPSRRTRCGPEVMPFQASSAVGLPTSAFRRSDGSLCTTPPGTRNAVTAAR